MKKLIISFFITIFFLVPQKSLASDPNFDISINSSYDVHENGITTLTQKISIKNKTDYYFTPSYSVSVGFKNIQNIVAFGENGSIPFTLDDTDKENKNIKLKFEKRFAGKGTTNDFTLKLDSTDIAAKRGNIWEISIPGISSPDDFLEYNNTVSVPESFGKLSISKPSKDPYSEGTIKFDKKETGKAGIFLLYGKSQYYSFELNYHITNPNLFPVKTEIALPSNTNYQNVLISSFSEKPSNVEIDKDGNWIAQYSLFPQQKLSIVVKGFVEILPEPEKEQLTDNQFKSYLSPKKYWETKDESVKEISKKLKSGEDVYNYITESLNYNFGKVTSDNRRLGALGSLKNPDNSVCLEFTDLFVTLARASGIPARAVEGYAYTENSVLRPLSLLEDVLHSWPEYYDINEKRWIMVDPTWGNTTKGLDYFNTLDFEHIAFVIKGSASDYPIPAGGYKFDKKSKDVKVTFADRDNFVLSENIEITDTFPASVFPGSVIEGSFKILNTGNSLIKNKTAIVTDSSGLKKEYIITNLPPGGFKTINLRLTNSSFLTNGQKILKIRIDKFDHNKKIAVSFIPDLSMLILFGGIIFGAITITIITYYTGSVLIQRRKRGTTLRGKSKGH